MTPKRMENNLDQKLAELIQRELRELPEIQAPRTLMPRVLAAIQHQARKPWWQRPWTAWPVGFQCATLMALFFLVGFVFSDESGTKVRPALVVSSAAYHRRRQDVIVAAITSNTNRRLFGDHRVTEWKGAGLLFPSVVTGVLRTVKGLMIERKLGSMPLPDMAGVDLQLRRILSV